MDLRRRDGFALIAVLWVLVCLGAIALELHLVGGGDRQVAANARAAARARWTARSGLAGTLDALDGLLASDSAVRSLAAAGDTVLPPLRTEHEGVALRVLVLDAGARVNLNRADAAELRRLFATLGVVGDEPAPLALAVVEARGGGFARVPELRAVPGVSPALFARVAPHLTLAGDGRINVNSAPVPVLATLPGMDEDAARALVARRARLPFANLFEVLDALPRVARERVQAELPSATDRMVFGPREVEIRVEAQARGSAVVSRLHAAVLLDGGSRLSLRSLVER